MIDFSIDEMLNHLAYVSKASILFEMIFLYGCSSLDFDNVTNPCFYNHKLNLFSYYFDLSHEINDLAISNLSAIKPKSIVFEISDEDDHIISSAMFYFRILPMLNQIELFESRNNERWMRFMLTFNDVNIKIQKKNDGYGFFILKFGFIS